MIGWYIGHGRSVDLVSFWCILLSISCHNGSVLWLAETVEYLPIDFCFCKLSLEIHWLRSDSFVFKWGRICLGVQIHFFLLKERIHYFRPRSQKSEGPTLVNHNFKNNATIQTVLFSFRSWSFWLLRLAVLQQRWIFASFGVWRGVI